jgi:hypothetical protein
MEKTEFYTKGDRDDVLSRIGQVHTITLFCPLNDFCVRGLMNTFEIMLPQYKVDADEWKGVPAIDALNAFIFSASFHENFSEINKDIVALMISSLKMFKKLKLINFKFTFDEDIENTYKLLLQKDRKEKIKKYIYNVELLELNFSDMFSQRMIDMLNKIFIYNSQIPNSYLDRKFMLEFSYDDYNSFMNMFVTNNKEELDKVDRNICDYIITFPKLVKEQKPRIRILTNYVD